MPGGKDCDVEKKMLALDVCGQVAEGGVGWRIAVPGSPGVSFPTRPKLLVPWSSTHQ